MATKTISLELDAYEMLKRAKREGESFSGVVRRARFGPVDSCGRAILEALGTTPARKADVRAAEHWEAAGLAERTISASPWEGEPPA